MSLEEQYRKARLRQLRRLKTRGPYRRIYKLVKAILEELSCQPENAGNP